MRLSDAERDEAIEALSEHVRTGRLDVEEFGTRSAKTSTAKTRSDLAPLFADLPAPHPSVLTAPAAPAPAPGPAPARRFAAGAVPIAAIIAVLLFFTVARGLWLVFLLPAAAALLFAGRNR
ncbi:MAG TPA: DUF1707 domain-containing protein [Amycolatopsis sp.]|jgi:hypothetical protein|nr:DUF1707 domain-containing protein [Amycolatopsis sp.]